MTYLIVTTTTSDQKISDSTPKILSRVTGTGCVPCVFVAWAIAAMAITASAEPLFVGVTRVEPTTVAPDGGQLVTIWGVGFRAPVRVLCSIEGAVKEAYVVSATYTTLQVISPP